MVWSVTKDEIRDCLRRADMFAKEGNIPSAVEDYLAFATWAQTAGAHLKAVAVYRQVLDLAPSRRDVRRRLVEGYVALGLVDDARVELERILADAREAGDPIAVDDARSRLADLRPSG